MGDIIHLDKYLANRDDEMEWTAHFGACPQCGRADGVLNAGKGHWAYCADCKTKWYLGAGLFSVARDETEAEQRAKWDEVGMSTFREVAPVHDEDAIRRLRVKGGE